MNASDGWDGPTVSTAPDDGSGPGQRSLLLVGIVLFVVGIAVLLGVQVGGMFANQATDTPIPTEAGSSNGGNGGGVTDGSGGTDAGGGTDDGGWATATGESPTAVPEETLTSESSPTVTRTPSETPTPTPTSTPSPTETEGGIIPG